MIGHTFGDSSDSTTLFKLPNVDDNVMGISGTNYDIGDSVGSSVTLTQSNLPSHYHLMVADQTSCTST